MTVADRLLELRTERGWSQTQLANKAGVTQKTVSNIEGGEPYHDSTIKKLAKAFGVAPSDITGKVAPNFRARGNPDNPPTRADVELAYKIILELEKQEELSRRKVEELNRIRDATTKGTGGESEGA